MISLLALRSLRSLRPLPTSITTRSTSTSNYYSRPLLTHLLTKCPRLVKVVEGEEFEPLFDTGELGHR